MGRTVRSVVVLAVLLFFLSGQDASAAEHPSVEEMAGAMIMTGFRGTTAPSSVLRAVAEGRLGGIILFDRGEKQGETYNIESPGQLKRLIASLQEVAPRTLLVAVDQEGGKVRRLKTARGFSALPSAEEMGRMPAADVWKLGYRAGREMADLGINVNLAPVADIRRAGRSPGLGDAGRLFGDDPKRVSRLAMAFGDGLYQAGVLPALKHFPGLGSAGKDSHHDLPDITDTWSREELLPYRDAFAANWPGMVLVAHVYHRELDENLPSSLSPSVVNGLLREELGWNGVVISDDLQMGAASRGHSLEERVRLAVLAGNDILLFGNHLEYDPLLHERLFRAVTALVENGVIPVERLERSWRRIEAMKAGLAESRTGGMRSISSRQ